MNPLLFWIVVLTASVNRVERRLTVIQNDLRLLKGLNQIEDMEIDD